MYNPHQRTAAWLFVLFIAITLITLFAGNMYGVGMLIAGGILGAGIGVAWERSKH